MPTGREFDGITPTRLATDPPPAKREDGCADAFRAHQWSNVQRTAATQGDSADAHLLRSLLRLLHQ